MKYSTASGRSIGNNPRGQSEDIIDQMIEGGWKLGDPTSYNRELALYTSDCLEYVKTTQPMTAADVRTPTSSPSC